MAMTPKDIEVPKDRPVELRKHRQLGTLIAVLLSIAAHLFLLYLLFVTPEEKLEGFAGGAGWAEQIDLRAADESSSGLEGEEGTTADETAQVMTQLNVSIVYAPPPPPPEPEPEEYFPEDEPEPEEEIVEEEVEPEPQPEEVVESLIEEEEQEEEPTEDLNPEAQRATLENEAEVPTELPGTGAGEGGLSDQLAGSQTGDDESGIGIGNADAGRIGSMVPGGQLEDLLRGWTLVGTNGFADGSVNSNGDNRNEVEWRVYYDPRGRLDARYQSVGAPQGQARGNIGLHWYNRNGRWTVEGDELCQRIDRYGGGGLTCFQVRRDGNEIAMYYSRCRGVYRCWPGRLGPHGTIYIGRHLDGNPGS